MKRRILYVYWFVSLRTTALSMWWLISCSSEGHIFVQQMPSDFNWLQSTTRWIFVPVWVSADLAERAVKTESFCSFLRLTFQLHNRYRSQNWNMNEDKRCVWRAATGWERGHGRQSIQSSFKPYSSCSDCIAGLQQKHSRIQLHSQAVPPQTERQQSLESGGVVSPRWNCTDKLLIKVFPQPLPPRAPGVHSTFCVALANRLKVKKEVFYFPNPSQTAIGHCVIQSV